MSVKEMDALDTSSCESDPKQVLTSNECEPTNFRNNSHSVRILEDLQSQRKNEVLCDIRFETDDGCTTFGHKNVLMAASQYFSAMFKSRKIGKTGNNTVNIRKLDSTVLQLLLDYIYTGEIIVTKEIVQELLPAANLLQLDFVNGACIEFLQKQMDASNCLGIRAFADLQNCTELLSSCEAFIKKHFLEVVKSDDFLSLSSEDLVKIISCNDLAVPYEEKVLDCVMKWVKHDLDSRKDFLPELMEHVRLPLLKPEIIFKISEEPLLKNSPKCKDYVYDAIQFNLQKSVQHFTIPKTIRCKRRQFGGSQKVILMFNPSGTSPKCYTEWYDPVTKLRENAPGLKECRKFAGLAVIKDQFVFAVGGVNGSSSKSVGGRDGNSLLNSVEVFNVSIQKWQMVSSMSIERSSLGVGVFNNHLYAVGGFSGKNLKSVEYYDPTLDTWTPVAEMSEYRQGVGVGVLDGLIYAIGGYAGSGKYLKSVEVYRPSDGVWSFVADMNLCRYRPGVAVLDGLLYVMGGESDVSIINDTVEIYNLNTNTWTIERLSRNKARIYGGVVVDRL